jgi:hypothetical protein
MQNRLAGAKNRVYLNSAQNGHITASLQSMFWQLKYQKKACQHVERKQIRPNPMFTSLTMSAFSHVQHATKHA